MGQVKRSSDILAAVIVAASHAACLSSYSDPGVGIDEGAHELRRIVGLEALPAVENAFRDALLMVARARALT